MGIGTAINCNSHLLNQLGGPRTPATILGSKLVSWFRSDLGVTLRATRTSGAETYALTDGWTLIQNGETATFNTADFADIANATSLEVVAVINTDWTTDSATDTTGDFTITGSGVLTGTALAALGLSANPFVSAWADQKSTHDVLQATVGNQPVYVSTGGPNSLPYIEGDGATDHLRDTTATLDQPNMIWTIAMPSISDAASKSLWDGTSANQRRFYSGSSSTANLHAGGAVNFACTLTDFHKFRALYSGSASEVQVDADAEVTGDPGTGGEGGITLMAAGTGTAAGDARMCEFFITNADCTAAEQAGIEDYLDGRYGLL